MLELLIGLVVTFAVGYFIVKGYKPAGILLTAGILLLILIVSWDTKSYLDRWNQ